MELIFHSTGTINMDRLTATMFLENTQIGLPDITKTMIMDSVIGRDIHTNPGKKSGYGLCHDQALFGKTFLLTLRKGINNTLKFKQAFCSTRKQIEVQ